MMLSILLATPIIAALLSWCVRARTMHLELIAAIAGSIELAATLGLLLEVGSGTAPSFTEYFSLDALGMVVLLPVAIIGCAAAWYSIGYLREETRKGFVGFHRIREYFILFHIFVAAMAVAVSAAHPIVMWIAVEATTLSTVFLISIYNKPSSIEAAWKYLLINSIGLLLGFFGTLLFFTSLPEQTSFINWQDLLSGAPALNPVVAKIAFIFVLVGYGTKVGLAPMHTWLPDAHSKAPSPISALLSGALLNVAFLAILRFKGVSNAAVGQAFSENLLILFGILSLGIAACIILVQKKYKRLFAYSSIEHMGVLALGFGFGGAGTLAGLLHMIYHSLAKSLLFLSAGNIFLKYGKSKIENVKGLFSTLPVTAVFLFIGFLAITGMPPFGLFLTEFAILAAGIRANILVTVLVLIFLALVFVGFLRHIVSMSFGNPPESVEKGELGLLTLIPPALIAGLLALLSVAMPEQLRLVIVAAVTLIH